MKSSIFFEPLRQPFIFLFGVAFNASKPSVPVGKIREKIDLQDREYNSIEASDEGRYSILSPGKVCLLSKGAETIGFSRRYRDYTSSYEVCCPFQKGISAIMKVIDAHLNRVSGACKRISAAKGCGLFL